MRSANHHDTGADARGKLASVLDVLAPVLDVVRGPIESAEPPQWCEERGWVGFLLGLSDPELEACERLEVAEGLCKLERTPADLSSLAQAVRRVTRLPRFLAPKVTWPEAAVQGIRARKREQLDALLGALEPLVESADRIVDVGAGSGHLSRLAAELFARRTWALDRDGERLQRGRQRSEQRARRIGELNVQFVEIDAVQRTLDLRVNDLAIGLHACGELGDRLVQTASNAGCGLALISCCLQRTSRTLRSPVSRAGAGLTIERTVLGLTNLTSRGQGVEASLAANLAARETRLALRYLLRQRGLRIGAGEEMRGINRRRAHAGFDELARFALARRGLSAPTPAELATHALRARRDYTVMRRLALPRNMLARVVELAVVLDRAALLEERGHYVRLGQFVEQRVTPRNTVLFASRHAERLPSLVPDSDA